MNQNTIHIIQIPEAEESKVGIKNLYDKIMTANFPNLVKEKDT